jgi:hypothetical protein
MSYELSAVLSGNEELSELVVRSATGDEEAALAVRQRLSADPRQFARLAFDGGDGDLFSADMLDTTLRNLIGEDVWERAKTELRLRELRAELEGRNASILVRLLVTRVIVCWVNLASIEATAEHDLSAASERRIEWWQRRIERAQRMYVGAIKALAQVRRLQLPVVQVNVAAAGGQQINMAAPVQKQNGRLKESRQFSTPRPCAIETTATSSGNRRRAPDPD